MEEQGFVMDEDEQNHLEKLPKGIVHLLHLVNEGAKIAGNLASPPPGAPLASFDDPGIAKAMIVLKSSEILRFSCNGLLMGYYLGVALVQRPLYEGMALGHLFASDPNGPREISEWAKELARRKPNTEEEKRKTNDSQRKRRERATDAFRQRTSRPARLRKVIRRLGWSSGHIHTSYESLVEGFDFGYDQLSIPDNGAIDQNDLIELVEGGVSSVLPTDYGSLEQNSPAMDEFLDFLTLITEEITDYAAREFTWGREWLGEYEEWKRQLEKST